MGGSGSGKTRFVAKPWLYSANCSYIITDPKGELLRSSGNLLKEMGYEIKTGKDVSVRPQGKERFFRLARNLGEGYTIEGIRKRILAQTRPERPAPRPEGKRYRLKGSLTKTKKATGFRALYFHYCYLLGISQSTSYRGADSFHSPTGRI